MGRRPASFLPQIPGLAHPYPQGSGRSLYQNLWVSTEKRSKGSPQTINCRHRPQLECPERNHPDEEEAHFCTHPMTVQATNSTPEVVSTRILGAPRTRCFQSLACTPLKNLNRRATQSPFSILSSCLKLWAYVPRICVRSTRCKGGVGSARHTRVVGPFPLSWTERATDIRQLTLHCAEGYASTRQGTLTAAKCLRLMTNTAEVWQRVGEVPELAGNTVY